ncbi:MAG: DUF262 domain-containing protein [Actinobacteria bacterium]|nr:MAG: DUF262 domain-containing protein [Actinomycetota bacterium]
MPQVTEEETLFDVAPDEESEDDLAPSTPEAASQAVVSGTDWTAATIINQLDRGTIELDPSFQRREAWTDLRKSAFIESLILGLPIPQLVLAERADRRGAYLVIDGKQRLLALRRFAASPESGFEPLTLRHLEVRKDLEGYTLADMRAANGLFEDVSAFENQPIRTVVVKAWPDESFLFRVFLRLNNGSVRLTPQELRQALHPGPFINFADEWSANSQAIRKALNLKKPDFRMRDVELLIRFMGFHLFLADYAGSLKGFLDETCASLNSAWSERQAEVEDAAQNCDSAINATQEIFGEDAFRQPIGNGRRGRFNRAIFDVMAYYFSDAEIRDEAVEKAETVKALFEVVWVSDKDFVEAITRTTKSIPATHSRLAAWGNALNDVLDQDIPVPKLEGNRIHP